MCPEVALTSVVIEVCLDVAIERRGAGRDCWHHECLGDLQVVVVYLSTAYLGCQDCKDKLVHLLIRL